MELLNTVTQSYGVQVLLTEDLEGVRVEGARAAQAAPLLAPHKSQIISALRRALADQKIQAWREYCTPQRGYDWTISGWEQMTLHDELGKVADRFASGEATLHDLHAAFVRYAVAHRPVYAAPIAGQLYPSPVVQTGQWDTEEAERYFPWFGVSLDEMRGRLLEKGGA